MSKTNDLKWYLIVKCQYLLNDLLIGELDLKLESYIHDYIDMNLNKLINSKLEYNEVLNDIFELRITQLNHCEINIKEGNYHTALNIISNLYYDMNLDIIKHT